MMDSLQTFTSREIEVLEHLKTGAANKEIAYRMGLAETTVKVHLKNIGIKFGVRTRFEVVLKYMEANRIEAVRDKARIEFLRGHVFTNEIDLDDFHGLSSLTGQAFNDVLDKMMDRVQAR